MRIKSNYSEDDIIELALDIGADNVDFQTVDNLDLESESLTKAVIVDPEFCSSMQDAITSKLGVEVSGSLEYIPTSSVTVSDVDYQKNMDLIEVFEGLDDVDKVYHNIDDSI